MRFFPLIRAGRPAGLMSCLLVLPMMLLAVIGRFVEPTAALLNPLVCFFFYPVLLCVAGLWGGMLPLALGLLAAPLALGFSFGARAALLAALYLYPFAAAFVCVVARQTPFFKAVAWMAGALLLSQIAAYLILKAFAGGDIAVAAGTAVADWVKTSPDMDTVLFAFYQSGLITVKSELLSDYFVISANSILSVTAQGREQMLLALASAVEDRLFSLPSLILSGSILYSVGGLGLSLYIGRVASQRSAYKKARRAEVEAAMQRRREAAQHGEPPPKIELETPKAFRERLEKAEQETPCGFPDLKMPPLSKWYLPRGAGLQAGLFALGYLPLLFSDQLAAVTVGQMMTAVFSGVYTVQGMAALNFLQKKAGVRAGGRRAALIVIYLLAPVLLILLGVLDQLRNFRALRPPLGNNTDREE